MSERQETTEDIIAEMDRVEVCADGEPCLRDYARRFEAAHKREKAEWVNANAGLAKLVDIEKVGDCAKLRAALKLCMDELCDRCRDLASARGNPLPCLNGCEPVCKAKAALAEPPRNCDVYNNESCRMAHHLHGDGLMTMQAFADWLFAPATEQEGGAK